MERITGTNHASGFCNPGTVERISTQCEQCFEEQRCLIAQLAVYLAADESRITTGQVIPVDSGVTIY